MNIRRLFRCPAIRTARLTLILALLLSALVPATGSQAARERCFAETNLCIRGVFLEYWETHGGLPMFGFPISEERIEEVEGKHVRVQWFERQRLEDHGAQGIMMGRIGARLLELQWRPWPVFPRNPGIREGCVNFSETQHSLCEPFLSYWNSRGGLQRFGYPITEPHTEEIEGRSYTVQYFERSRLELHPELPGNPIAQGLLGHAVRELLRPTNDPHYPGDRYPDCLQRIIPALRTAYSRMVAPEVLGCAGEGGMHEVPGSVQHFERGLMLWFYPGPYEPPVISIAAITEPDRRSMFYNDSWQQGQDPDTPPIAPPGPGLYAPWRGFGKLWARDPELRAALGWAVEPEARPITVSYQYFRHGFMLRVHQAGTVYAFRSLSYNGPLPHVQLIEAQ